MAANATAGTPQTRCRSQAAGGFADIQTRPSGLTDRSPSAPATVKQVANELFGRLVAAVPVLGHQLHDHGRQVGRDRRVDRTDVGRGLLLMLDQFLEDRPVRKRRPAREHVKERAAKRIQVAPDVDVAGVAGLFGADVIESAERHPALGEAVVAARARSDGPGPCRRAWPGREA